MSKSEKKCSVPDCKKAVFGPRAFFCGEHERDFQGVKKVGEKVAEAALGLGVSILFKKLKK